MASSVNASGLSSMTQAATNLTAAGANLLKLNQQSASAIQGLLPNSTLTVDAALNKVKTGLDSVFSSQGASATATQFFRAAKETSEKIASDVKSITEKIASGANPSSLTSTASQGLTALTKVVGSTITAASSAATSVTNYIAGAGSALSQTGSINTSASAAVSSTISGLQQAGTVAGVNTAQLAAANKQVSSALGSLSQALKIPAPGAVLPGGLPAIPNLPAIPAIDPAQVKAATAAIEAAQNPPNPLAQTGAKIGAIDRSKLDSAFLSALPPGLPNFDPGTIAAAQQAGAAINTARFKNVPDKDLTYSGPDPTVWDEINNERLRRGLSGLPNSRPSENSDYVKKYSQPAYSGG